MSNSDNLLVRVLPYFLLLLAAVWNSLNHAQGDGRNKRGWFDIDGNWVESDGGVGMAGEGWTEHNRITWAEYNASRKQLQETVNINAGLFALKRCNSRISLSVCLLVSIIALTSL